MAISRSKVTEIYENARYKIADSIVKSKTLLIARGHYHLCDGSISGICKQDMQKVWQYARNRAKGRCRNENCSNL